MFSYPRRNAISRAIVGVQNAGFRLTRREFRVFTHPPEAMVGVLREQGLAPRFAHDGAVWRIAGLAR